MIESHVIIDPTNVGEVMACIGILRIADDFDKKSVCMFVPTIGQSVMFVLRSSCSIDEYVNSLILADFQVVEHEIPSISPIILNINKRQFYLNWWLNYNETESSCLKLWSGQGSPYNIFSKLLESAVLDGGFIDYHVPLSGSRFGFDYRSAWTALDLGYSPNNENEKTSVRVLVELLCAVGLQEYVYAFNLRDNGKRAREIEYRLWTVYIPLGTVAMVTSGVAWTVPTTKFVSKKSSRGAYKYFRRGEKVE